MTVSDLPAVNAMLNATSAVLLGAGFYFIRRREIGKHRACMLAAFGVSTVFLMSYILYHATHGSTAFPGTGWPRTGYLTLLLSHVLLATLVLPLALVTLYRAISGQFGRHRAIAHVTLPIWLYVSVTGVLVYWILYHYHGYAA